MDFFDHNQPHASSSANRNLPDLKIRISRDEYDDLVQTAQYYGISPISESLSRCKADLLTANLRTNLLDAGINELALQLLCDSLNPPREALDQTSTVFQFARPLRTRGPSRRYTNLQSLPQSQAAPRSIIPSLHRSHAFVDSDDVSDDNSVAGSWSSQAFSNPAYLDFYLANLEKQAARSIQLTNLPEGVTLADITSVVRGGQLIDIFLRSREKAVSISFLHGDDAVAFYNYVLKHDLYIKNKPVDIRWYDRQYTLSGHVASKIRSGATRNLVISSCDPSLTEEDIRDDLEHIHNLLVVQVYFIDGDCYISTNSVSGAMFAKTCMMSRLKYKGCRIDWAPDECDLPLDQMPHPSTQIAPLRTSQKVPTKLNPSANRFECLDFEA